MKLDGEALKEGVTVADGGWSTQLQVRGLAVSVMAETASCTHPELVVDLGRDYVEAGARFITTNTFAANQLNVERRRIKLTVAELNRAGAELAREAVGDSGALVAGSIGPSGKILAVREATEAQLMSLFEEQAKSLADGGVDVIVLETFSEMAEILLALKVVKDATGLPVIGSMSFDSGPQRTRTMMGALAGDCAAALEDAGADLVGCNCGSGIEHVLPAVVALRAATELPLWVKPNAGLPELEDGQTVWKQTPEEFAAHVPTLLDAGVNIIGGCCGSGPEHIRRVAAVVAKRRT
uniref:Bifunctional homocysteine S-methyltransferase/5,10-methylenetetrahydrofolate reductase n=1 Tax=uncultured Planctomycetota bacterium TaxID=120965 RepID=A0A5B8KBD5_9BACT|nr:bifunctional homocysteine S-methyltransferase/5,10-methylenetetrahydrofolate reductase [uncultured Planctomycetota bacterium]